MGGMLERVKFVLIGVCGCTEILKRDERRGRVAGAMGRVEVHVCDSNEVLKVNEEAGNSGCTAGGSHIHFLSGVLGGS